MGLKTALLQPAPSSKGSTQLPRSFQCWDQLMLAHNPLWSIPRSQPPCKDLLPHLLSSDQENNGFSWVTERGEELPFICQCSAAAVFAQLR